MNIEKPESKSIVSYLNQNSHPLSILTKYESNSQCSVVWQKQQLLSLCKFKTRLDKKFKWSRRFYVCQMDLNGIIFLICIVYRQRKRKQMVSMYYVLCYLHFYTRLLRPTDPIKILTEGTFCNSQGNHSYLGLRFRLLSFFKVD